MWERHDCLKVHWWQIQRDASPATADSYCSSSQCLWTVFPCICSALFNETCLTAYNTGDFLQYACWTQLQEQIWAGFAQKSCLLLIVPNREIYWRAGWRGSRIQVHNHHGCMLGFRETGLNKHALVKEYRAAKPGWPCTAIQLQKQTSACSYLRFLHLNDPGGRHNDSSVSPQGTWLLNVM